MKKIYTYLQLGLGLLIALAIPHLGLAQTCDVTPMNISKLATDWTTNCARVSTDQCDPTNGPLCSSAANSNWLLLNQNDYCLPKPPCNAVGFAKVEVTMTMEGTWTVKNIGNQSQNTSIGLLGCVKAWIDDMLFDPLEPSAFTGIITLAPNEEKSGLLPTRTKTSQFSGNLNDLFAKSCAGTLCVEGLADGFTTLTISNGNLQAITTVLASLKACVNYQKFTWNVTGTEAACETSADGRVFINFTPAPGTNASDYEIRVGNGASWTVSVPATNGSNVVSGLPAGSYTVAVVYKPLATSVVPTDSESCGYCKASVTIAAATATLSCSSTPDCPGGTGDGTVTVNVTGSNLGTVKYLWNNNRTTATITGLTAGNYTVTVTYGPNDKCSKVTTCTVAQAPAVNADVSSTNVICNGANNGTITVDPTSGTANYIIAVTGKPNQTSSGEAKVFNNLAPGTYTITVTDANGCIFTGMVTITEPTPVNGTLTPTPAACTGATNGSAIASGSGGTGPYTYNWSRGTVGGGGTTVTGLTPGPISVTITDNNLCTKVLSGTIGTVSEVAITCTPTAERCVDENNGSVSVAVSNASPNYTASWISGPTQFSQVSSPTSPVVVSGLAPGTYTIRITDNNGCYAECTFTINEGLDLPCSISGSSTICQGVTENIHSVTAVSGATYAWTLESNTAGASISGSNSNSTVTVSIPSNATGSYTIRMTISKDGCSKTCTKTVSITQPVACNINGPAAVCEGSTAIFTTTGVTTPVWTVSGGLSFSGQGTTSITVTIPDGTVLSDFTVGLSGTGSNGCPTNCNTTTTINQKPTSAVEPLSPVCNLGLPQGGIQAYASGAAPFVYRLYKHNPARTLVNTSAATANTTYDFTNLGPGTYDVEVTDANNCTSDPSATIILDIPVAFEPELDCESRNGGNIDVVLNITNGTGPFTYSLDNNTFIAVPGNGIITIPFVDGSNQTIYIEDDNDCPAISETLLLQCCKLAGVCKLTTPAPITGCDLSGVPGPKTNPTDVFSGVTFCVEAKITTKITDGGSLCGGGLTRTYGYTLYDDLNDNDIFDIDEPFIAGNCSETYTVTPPSIVLTCPVSDLTIPACTSAEAAQILLTNYKALFSFSGGCNATASFSTVTLPDPCVGGTVSITYTVVSDCETQACTQSIIRTVNPAITLNCADNASITTCRTQAQINSDFSNWLAQFSVTGGCNATGSFDGEPTAPLACGGTTTVTYRVVDAFGCNTQTCTKTFTVTPPALVINCPEANLTIPACTSASAAQTLLDNYKALFSFSGGCNAQASFSAVTLPNPCVGGTVSIIYTVVSDCDTKACTKSIIRTVNPAITLNCADNVNITICRTQAQVNNEFSTWLAQFSVTGGCNATGSFDGEPTAPLACGGTTTVTYRVVDAFGCNTQTCTRTFTVTPPALVINCPEANLTIPACTSASAAQTLLDNYKALFSFSGGCNAQASFSTVTLPNPCVGGTVSITYTVVSDCDTKACTKSITRTVNPAITLNCADNVNITICRTQAQVNSEFSNWLAQFSVTGGCNATGSFDGEPTAPLACGGTTTVTYRVVDAFGCNTQTCTKTFTVTPPALVINCPEANLTIPACTSAAAAQTLLNNYKALFSFSGGCNAQASFSAVTLPDPCVGGTVSITYTVVSDCDTKACTKSITRTVNPAITLVCADNVNITTCKTQAQVNSEFSTWLTQFSVTGGCNATGSFDGQPAAPLACGGTTTVTYRVVDAFGCNTQTCTKTFTVTPPALNISVPEAGLNIPACTSAAAAQTLLNNYKALFSFSGGCNASASFSTVTLPDYCKGGNVSITYTVVSDCDTKSATRNIGRAAEPALSISCPQTDLTIAHSLTEAESKALLDNYKATFSYSGGCNTTVSFSVVTMPDVCLGGETTITYTVTSDCDTKTCTKKIIRIANPVPTVDITVDGPTNFCEKGSTKVIIKTSEQNKPYDIFFTDFISSVSAACLPTAVGGAYIIQDDANGIDTIELNNLPAGTYKYAVSNVVDKFGCTSALDLSDTVSITAYPIPVGEDFNKTIYSCLPASVNLPLRVKCNVPSTFTWFSVASLGSSVPYDNPNVAGESFNPAGTSNVITDVLTNLIGTPQTVIYRVVPTSDHNCVGEPFYITVIISPRANIECLACMTQVRVTLDDKCRKLITPNLVVDGFAECPNRELLQEALEVLIDDGNNDSYVDCAGTYKYIIRIKPEFASCFDYQPCWGTLIAEDKTGPIIECVNWVEKPLDCYDVNYVLNNYRTIGKVGENRSPRPSAVGNQIIPNAEGIGEAGTCNLLPPNLVADNIRNLGYVYFRDNCRNCGCRTTVKWNDKVEFYSCEQMRTNGNIYARIYRTWVATDCNGMTADTVQVINFTRPALSDFVFNGPGDGGKYDRVVTYNACTADKNLIKKEDVTPYICSFFNAENNPRCLFIDQVECNYSVSIKDTEFPICGGKGVKIDREIYVFDWCAGGIVDTFHILIKIGDFEAPTVEYAHGAPYDVSTGPMDCTAAVPVTVAGLKSVLGVTIKDNCTLGNVSVSVYTKDRYVKGILVYEGPANPFCPKAREAGAELRGDHDSYRLGSCNKDNICWDKVDYAVMNGMMIGLPVGRHLMVIDAFDGCYNTSTTCFIFDVKDKIAPVMKCDDDLHVTLSNANGYTSGYAQVSADDIDEGSWDNCKLAWIAVRRNVPDACAASFIAKGYDTNGNGKLDALGADNDYSKADGFDLNGDGDIADFGETFIIKGGKLMTPLADFVEFFCCDQTERVTVELWGGDTSGNTNYCWMDLLIEDKVAPTCIAPWDITIFCDDKNIGQIDNKLASAKIFGDVTITTGNDCAALDTVYTTEKKLKCGAGWIDRIWTLTKQTVKGPITIICKQRINILPVHEYNICFPKDVSGDCKKPIIDTVLTDELACDILAVNVSDKRYDASDDECYKIFRTYTVINWCVYDDRCGDPMAEGHVYVVDRATFGNYGKAPLYVLVRDANRDLTEEFYLSKDLIAKNADDIAFKPPYCEQNSEFYHSFMYTQIIKVYDSELPVVTGKRDTFCTSPTACTANITKVVTIKDNCTDKVELERQFLMIAPFQTTDAGKMILYSTPRWSVKELGNGQFEITVSNLPEGIHDLIVVGRDECGNLSVATRIPFVVKDCKAPAPICINGLSTELMPDGNGGGMMAVWASDFVASKIYDCNGQGPETNNGLKLVTKYSINRVGSPVVSTQTGINLTCADAGKVVLVELHAWDNAGNHDFCVTFVEVQDNRKVCPDPSTVVTGEISGLISTDEAEPVSGVKIDVSGDAQMNQNSTNNGVFNFNNLAPGSDFTVTAQLDKDHLNGVSTFDLVQLQKHILGVKPIDNPYRLIAADVNNSKSISTLDMIQIRKLILNIDQRFNNVPSWRFVDAAYKFPNPSNPWQEAFPEVVNINDLAGKVQANFVAIKMGDVNGSATVSSASTAEVRSSKTLKLSTEEQQLKAGQSYTVAIRAEDLAAVQGFQFTLQADLAQVQLENIEYNGAMKADHFGFFPQNGQLTSSFVRAPLVGAHSTTLGQDLLFTLHLKAEADGLLSEVLNINSRLTPQEAYSTQDELMNVALKVNVENISDRAVLHQNTPNPFVEETSIGFYLPQAGEATLTVRDVKGALLYRQEGNFAKGENQILLKHAQLRSSGVLYYTLETVDFTASKKMVLINK